MKARTIEIERGMTVAEIAEFLGGTVVGPCDSIVTGASSIEEAEPGDITFAEDPHFIDMAENSDADVIIVPLSVAETGKTIIRVENPRFAFAKVATLFTTLSAPEPGIHPSAVVAADARLEPGAAVGARVVIDSGAVIGADSVLHPGVVIGRNSSVGRATVLYPNVVIYPDTSIGSHCVIHAGAVLGSDGFGFVKEKGKHYKIPQTGRVIVEDDVEIGANCTVDRAASGATVIGAGTKIDNLVHIAHNVSVGRNCLIIAQVGISGSVSLGDNVTLAGQAGVAGHISIGDNTVVAAKAGVTKSIPSGIYVSGFPAKPHQEEKKIKVSLTRLPEMLKKVGHLTQSVQRLARRLDRIEAGRRG